MIDYHARLASLAALDGTVAATPAGGPSAARAAATHAAVAAHPEYAALGALVDCLLEHAECTDEELGLLERAAGIYRRGLDYLELVADLRSDLEQALAKPDAADALARFNGAVARAKAELPKAEGIVADAHMLADSTDLPSYLRPHGQADDLPVSGWPWRDVVLARRSDAFCQALAPPGEAGAELSAFGFGAFASYVGNALGSGYQNQVVGGVRRSQPMRDRIAKYAIGAWLRVAGLSPPLASLRGELRFGDPAAPSLPAELKTLLEQALNATYGSSGPPALPDIDHGYANLLRHLELVDAFPRPKLPLPLELSLATRVLASPAAVGAGSVTTKDGAEPGETRPVEVVTIGSNDDAAEKRKKVCGIIVIILICVLILLGTAKKPASTDSSPSPGFAEASSSEALTSYAASDDALAMVKTLHELHIGVYTALTTALEYLKAVGLIYPDELDLGEAGVAQFTALGPAPAVSDFPHRPGGPPAGYRNPPTTPVEQPASVPSHYPAGSAPSVFLDGVAPAGVETVAGYGSALWAASAAVPAGQRVNLNLDADRGFLARCWAVPAGSSIKDNPLTTSELAYDAV